MVPTTLLHKAGYDTIPVAVVLLPPKTNNTNTSVTFHAGIVLTGVEQWSYPGIMEGVTLGSRSLLVSRYKY